jgi:hypothetical protein
MQTPEFSAQAWNWDQPVEEMGGGWMKVEMPIGRWNKDISLDPKRSPAEVLSGWLLPSTIERMRVEMEESEATAEVLFITSILEELAEAATESAIDLAADEFLLSAEDAEVRAGRYRQSAEAIMEIWECPRRSPPQSADNQQSESQIQAIGHHPLAQPECRIRGWLFSWQAFNLGLKWWNWKPVVKTRWETPTSGPLGNQLRQPEASITLEWLSAFVQFTITPENSRQ